MQSLAIFPLFYLPPIDYLSALEAKGHQYQLEKFEHFPKQTYRNRTRIYSPNGVLDLIVPVVKGSNVHTKMKDVRISYDFRWQRGHWRSLQTCYRSSAYFEYYEDELAVFYEKRYEYLFDYNLDLMTWVLKQLKKEPPHHFTKEYENGTLEEDYRNMFNVKDKTSIPANKPYYQVFEDRNGFIPNLSVVDLLFNQGPQAKNYI